MHPNLAHVSARNLAREFVQFICAEYGRGSHDPFSTIITSFDKESENRLSAAFEATLASSDQMTLYLDRFGVDPRGACLRRTCRNIGLHLVTWPELRMHIASDSIMLEVDGKRWRFEPVVPSLQCIDWRAVDVQDL
ncbi:MAG: hypothetical protein IT435_04090 [Phycisphaerales bacterium]|nr:hypothetical protein [Phycisphaerales bacterium]